MMGGTRTIRDDAAPTEATSSLSPTDEPAHKLPTLGGRYDVLGLLGGGGMGSVYLAHDLELDERVAVKLLHASLIATPEQVDLLRREVKLARRVTHPNVVRTFDIGSHEGSKFLTMEYVPGSTLDDSLHATPLSLPNVARIANAVCAGLGAAHDVGILHRDLKPSNVLLADDGRILLSDFGISSLFSRGFGDKIVGTPAYMAPEAIRGESMDGRSDIYSLGVLLFEMFAGARPFAIRGFSDAIRLIDEAAPDLVSVRADVPAPIARVIARALSKTPAHRFGHPLEVSAAINAAMPSLPTMSVNLGAPRKRTRVLAILPFGKGARADDTALADGFGALLADRLASLDMRVLSPGTIQGGHEGSHEEMGRRMGAELVVSGSLSTNDDASVTVDVRVHGARDGIVLMTDQRSRPTRDLMRVAEETSAAIARALMIETDAANTSIPEGDAVELYLRGLAQYRRRWRGSAEEALRHARRANELLPDNPMVAALFAQTLVRAQAFAFVTPPGMLEEAQAACSRALALARDRPEPHLASAIVAMQMGNNVEAASSLVSALGLGPHIAEVHERIGLLALEVTDIDEAVARLTTAVTLDASLEHVRWWIAFGHALRREVSRCDEILSSVPKDAERLNGYFSVWTRTVKYFPTAARVAALRETLEAAPAFDLRPNILEIINVLGGADTVVPIALGPQTKEDALRRTAWRAILRTEDALIRDDRDRAMENLAVADRAQTCDINWLDGSPLFDRLRDRADFQAIRASIAARAAEVAKVLEPIFMTRERRS
jgi:serine/threonine-protein kinase